jgi:hypothetical protein
MASGFDPGGGKLGVLLNHAGAEPIEYCGKLLFAAFV